MTRSIFRPSYASLFTMSLMLGALGLTACGDDFPRQPASGAGGAGGAGGGTGAGSTGGTGAAGAGGAGGAGGSGGAGGAGGSGGSGGAGGSGGSGGAGGAGGGATCGGAIACFGQGTNAPAVGSGTCGDPYVVDMTGASPGDVLSYFVNGTANDEAGLGAVCGIDWSATQRDIVFLVQNMDNATTGLEISTDSIGGFSPMIAVAEDPACGQPLNACVDDFGDNMCEALCAPRGGAGFFGTSTFVVVSEMVTGNEPFSAHFRIIQ